MKQSPIARVLRTAVAGATAWLCLSALSAGATTLTNWARAGIATQSSTYNAQSVASKAIDGNTSGSWGDASTTQTTTANAGEWWQVDLTAIKPIGHIHLWFREDCCPTRNENLNIIIYDSTNVTTRKVMWETNNQAWASGALPRDIGFDLIPAVNGQVVSIAHIDGLPDYISLTEVEVFNQNLVSPTNWALAGTATSSSVDSNDTTDFGPQQANDGNHFGLSYMEDPPYFWGFSAPDIVTTNPDGTLVDPLPWWRVDLTAPSTVGSIVLWPRRDASYARFQNIRLTVADGSSNVLYQQVLTTQPSGPKFVVNLVPAVANARILWVETTTNSTDKYLNLPEVELIAPLASAPTITLATDLQNVTMQQNLPLIIGPVAPVVDGGIRPEDISYRWYRNGVAIPNLAGSWLAAYTAPHLAALTDSGDKYKVQVSVSGYGVFSSEVTVTVTNDITPPTIVTNQVQVTDQVRLSLTFSELLDPTTVTNLNNYLLTGGPSVGSLTPGADGKSVTLVIQNVLLGDSIALTVSGIKDLAGNTIVTKNISAAIPQTPINYARGGIAYQSSIYNNPYTVASKAIDGNTAGSWGSGSIACTANAGLGWWEVDMLSPKTIGSVEVWWRTDCCGTRNEHVDLVIYNSTNTDTRVELLRVPLTGTNQPPNPTIASFGSGQVGQVVYLEHTADTDVSTDINNEQICLAEVQVFPPPAGLVVSPDPSSWNVFAGDRIFLRSGSSGQTPITTQWLHNGVPIPGATSPELVITNITSDQAGAYVFMATNAVRARYSQPATVVVNPRPPMAYNLTARYLFTTDGGGTNVLDDAPFGPAKTVSHDGTNNGAVWVASVTDLKGVTRKGVMQWDSSLGLNQQIAIQTHPDFDSPVGTIAFWLNCAPPATKEGLFDRRGGTNNWGDVLILDENSTDSPNGVPDAIFDQCYPAGLNVGGVTPVDDTNWHHFAYVYTWLPFGIISFYVDGKLDAELTHGSPGAWPLDRGIEFGQSHDSYWPAYTGYMDDIHIFNRTLSVAEINQLMVGGVPPLPPTVNASVTNNSLTITWSQSGYILQQNGQVNQAAGWADISGATNGTYTIALPKTGEKFYRVRSLP